MSNPRRTGKQGQVLAQTGTIAVTGESLTPNATAEVVDGISYPAYSVFTATNALWVDNPVPSFTETIAIPVSQQSKLIRYELGKVIYTPALGNSDTVVADYSYATMMVVGNLFDWKLSVKRDQVDATAFMDGYKYRIATYLDWSGSADEYQTNAFWFNACTQNNFFQIKLYPDEAVTEYWVGRAIFDWDIDVTYNAVVKGAIKFTGTGAISYSTTP